MSIFDRTVAGLLPLVPRPLVSWFSRPYVAGARLEDALRLIRSLNSGGMMATLDHLGEDVRDPEEAAAFARSYESICGEIARSGVEANLSIKLSQLGLKISPETCERNLRGVLAGAREHGLFVRIDMEDSSCTAATLDLYRRVRLEFENVGVVLQAMLRRTFSDASRLAPDKANIRLCKGIYVEPWDLAYRDGELVNRNFILVLEKLLRSGSYVGIATHDERLVWEALRLVRELGLGREQYEFQMLLGVREELRRLILADGHRLRVYVPYGKQSQAYALRRLRENPRLAGHVARAVLRNRPRQTSGPTR